MNLFFLTVSGELPIFLLWNCVKNQQLMGPGTPKLLLLLAKWSKTIKLFLELYVAVCMGGGCHEIPKASRCRVKTQGLQLIHFPEPRHRSHFLWTSGPPLPDVTLVSFTPNPLGLPVSGVHTTLEKLSYTLHWELLQDQNNFLQDKCNTLYAIQSLWLQ